jgi:hypothetical protein
MSYFIPRNLNIHDIIRHQDTTSLRRFSSGRFSCFTFETPETWNFEVGLDGSSIMMHGKRSFTSDIFLWEMFHVSHSKHPKPESPK